MIRISRPPLRPEITEQVATLTEKIVVTDESERADSARRLWHGQAIIRTTIRETLRGMAAGREHCMYCGDGHGTDIDHFEPLARNPVRTFDWLNHLLACSTCNSHYKREQFPTTEDGRPLLIDPSAEDPFDHLLLATGLGVYVPLTKKGEITTEVCRLNRPLLVRGRQQARRVIGLCLRHWRDAQERDDPCGMREAALTVREQPFADVCQAMLRQADSPGAAEVFVDTPDELSLLRLPQLRAALLA